MQGQSLQFIEFYLFYSYSSKEHYLVEGKLLFIFLLHRVLHHLCSFCVLVYQTLLPLSVEVHVAVRSQTMGGAILPVFFFFGHLFRVEDGKDASLKFAVVANVFQKLHQTHHLLLLYGEEEVFAIGRVDFVISTLKFSS